MTEGCQFARSDHVPRTPRYPTGQIRYWKGTPRRVVLLCTVQVFAIEPAPLQLRLLHWVEDPRL